MFLDILQSVIALIVTLAVLIAVHEYGHFQVARWCGVHVERFSIGFGKALVRFEGAPPEIEPVASGSEPGIRTRANEPLMGTEYCVAMIPLGGYVKFLDERDGFVPEDQRSFAFNTKPLWQRALIAFAGPLANFLLAVVVYWMVFVMGVRDFSPVIEVAPGSPASVAGLQSGDEVLRLDQVPITDWTAFNLQLLDRLGESGSLAFEVSRAWDANEMTYSAQIPIDRWLSELADPNPASELGLSLHVPIVPAVLGEVSSSSPAEQGGLLTGDRVLSVNREPVAGWIEFVEFVRASPDQTLALRLERGNEVIDRWVTPEAVDDAGVEVGRIGAALGDYEFPPDRVRVREYSMLGAWVPAVQKTWAMTRFTVESLVKMIQGLLSPRNLSGPITIAKIAGQTAERGLDTYLGFIALISVSLAVLNLLPVPMLDGGHLLYYAVEALAGRPIPERLQYLGLQVGLVLLVGIMLLAFYNDLLRL